MNFKLPTLLLLPALCGILAMGEDANATRQWTSSDGSRTFEGKAVKYDGKQVTISRDGQAPRVFSVDLFSGDDKKWLDENRENLQKPSASSESSKASEGNIVGKQFGDMTYSMNAKEGLNGSVKLSWGKKQIKDSAKYYIILYSASWCPPCREEMPNVVNLYKDSIASDPDIDLVLCSCDQDARGMKEWAEKEGMPFPILPNDKQNRVPIAKELSPRGIPTAFLVDAATGKVVFRALPSASYSKYLDIKKGK